MEEKPKTPCEYFTSSSGSMTSRVPSGSKRAGTPIPSSSFTPKKKKAHSSSDSSPPSESSYSVKEYTKKIDSAIAALHAATSQVPVPVTPVCPATDVLSGFVQEVSTTRFLSRQAILKLLSKLLLFSSISTSALARDGDMIEVPHSLVDLSLSLSSFSCISIEELEKKVTSLTSNLVFCQDELHAKQEQFDQTLKNLANTERLLENEKQKGLAEKDKFKKSNDTLKKYTNRLIEFLEKQSVRPDVIPDAADVSTFKTPTAPPKGDFSTILGCFFINLSANLLLCLALVAGAPALTV